MFRGQSHPDGAHPPIRGLTKDSGAPATVAIADAIPARDARPAAATGIC